MQTSPHRLARIFSLATILVLVTSNAAAQRAAGDLVIGQSLDLSGPNTISGQSMREGAEARIRQANKDGGVAGRRLVLEVLDDKFDPKLTLANANKLVNEKKAVALLGTIGNPNAAVLQDFANANKVVVVGSMAGSPFLFKAPQRHAFYVTANYKTEADYCVGQLQSMALLRVASFFPDDEIGQANAQAVAEAVKQKGSVQAAGILYNRQKPDIAVAVKMLRESNAQAVVVAGTPKTVAALIQAIHEAKLAIRVLAFSVVSMTGVQHELKDKSAGVMFSQPLPYPRGGSSRFVQAFQRNMGTDPNKLNYAHMHGYLAASLLIEALKDSGGHGSEKLVQSLERPNGFDLNGYLVKFDRDQREGSNFVEMVLLGLDGRIVR